MRCTVPVALGTALVFAASHVSGLTAVTGWRQGSASFYGGAPDGMSPDQASFGTKEGSCGYGVLQKNAWPYWSVGALPTANSFFKSQPLNGCGECYEVACLENGPAYGNQPGSCQSDPNKRSIVVQITDQCPECLPDNLDLQALTWAQIANPRPSGGRINMQYRRVECVPPSDLIVNVNNNVASGWIRLQITSAGGPANVKNVAMRSHGSGAWVEANNLFGASWEIAQRPPPPVDVRVTNANGDQVIAQSAIDVDETGKIPTNVQFKISDPNDVQPSGKVVSGAGSGSAASSPSSSSSSSSSSSGGAPASADGGAQVSAFSGPDENSNSSSSASSSSSSTSSASASASSDGGDGGGSCEDKDPGNSQSCQANKAAGNCDQWWLKAGNYCAKTCGNCASGSFADSASG